MNIFQEYTDSDDSGDDYDDSTEGPGDYDDSTEGPGDVEDRENLIKKEFQKKNAAKKPKPKKNYIKTEQEGYLQVIQQRNIRLNINQFEFPSTILHFLYNKKPWYIVPVLKDIKSDRSTFQFVIHKYYENNLSTIGLDYELLLFLDQWYRSTRSNQNKEKSLAVFLFTILYYGLNVNGDDYTVHVWNYNIMNSFLVESDVIFICDNSVDLVGEEGSYKYVVGKASHIWDAKVEFEKDIKKYGIALQPYGRDIVGFNLGNVFTLKEFHEFIERTYQYHFQIKRKSNKETKEFKVLLKNPHILKMNLYKQESKKEFWCNTDEYSGTVFLFTEWGLVKGFCGNYNVANAFRIIDFKVFLGLVRKSIEFVKNNFIFFRNEFTTGSGKKKKYLYDEKDSLSVNKYLKFMSKRNGNVEKFYKIYLKNRSLINTTEGIAKSFKLTNDYNESLKKYQDEHEYDLDEDEETIFDGNFVKIREEADMNFKKRNKPPKPDNLENKIDNEFVIVYLRDRIIPKDYFIINRGTGKRKLDPTGIVKIFRRYDSDNEKMEYFAVLNPLFGEQYRNVDKMINIMSENKIIFTFDRKLHDTLEKNEILKCKRGEQNEEELYFDDFSFGVNYWQVKRMNKFRWVIRQKPELLYNMFTNFLGMVRNITSLTNIMSSETVVNLKREIDLLENCVGLWSGRTGIANEITNKWPKIDKFDHDHRVNIDNLSYAFEDIDQFPQNFLKFKSYVKEVQVPINRFDDLLCEDETNTLIRDLERVRRKYERMKIIIPRGGTFKLDTKNDFTEQIIKKTKYTALVKSKETMNDFLYSKERRPAIDATKSQKDYYEKLIVFRDKIQMRGIKKSKKLPQMDFRDDVRRPGEYIEEFEDDERLYDFDDSGKGPDDVDDSGEDEPIQEFFPERGRSGLLGYDEEGSFDIYD